MAAEDDLLALRSEFAGLGECVHLISHSLGAMPKHVRAHVETFLHAWEHDSIEAWHDWLPQVRELGDTIAAVIGARTGTVAIFPNVSTVQAVVASCFTFEGTRKKIVYDELNFSTVHYVWQEHARRGAEIVVVRGKDGVHPPIEELLQAIDEETLLVPISHVLFRSSGLYDAQRVIARAHEVGAMVLLDCYQSAGVVPLDVLGWGCDMACGGSVKWACGGPGAAYLYVDPEVLPKLSPMNAGWFSHREPFAFDMGPMRWADDAWKMIGGTMAIPAVYSAKAGWEILRRAGVTNVRKKSLRQTKLLRDLVRERGCTINTPERDDERGGTICFDFEGAADASKALLAKRYFHDYRPRCGIRVSPHFYTTDEELQSFAAALDEVRRRL